MLEKFFIVQDMIIKDRDSMSDAYRECLAKKLALLLTLPTSSGI